MSQQAIGKILLIARGTYDATATYNVLDWVRYNGRAWVCKNNGTVGVAPSESEYWALLAQDGSGGSGSGDMTKAEFSTNGTYGVVDSAVTLSGLTASIAELNYMDNVTSDVQTQLNGKIGNPVSKSDGQVLTYDGTNQVWKAQTPTTGVNTLAALQDVTVTSAASGQALTYNGSGWVNGSYDYTNLSNKPTIPTVDQTYSSISANAQSGTAVAGAIQGKANTSSLDAWTATETVSSGSVSFSGIDDSAGTNGYEPFPNITSSSTNKNPTFQISSISGTGTASMSVTFTTDADNGTNVKLRILK